MRIATAWARGLTGALLCAFCLLAALAPSSSAQQAQSVSTAGAVTKEDIEAALRRMEAQGTFFEAFAERETNSLASDRWYRLGLNYRGTAAILRRALDAGLLIVADLPPGRRSALGKGGQIVLDRDVDGAWGLAGDAEEERLRDVLLPALIEALSQTRLPQDWPWLADHLRAVGNFVEESQDPVLRPLLARYFQGKDSYLWLALRRIGEGDPSARRDLARRQQAAFDAVRDMESEMTAMLGASDARRLQQDWADYVGQVDGFAVTRGWVLLDPALQRTQLGAAARQAADAVDRAAAEVVASAPRSALAAARATSGAPAAALPRRATASPRAGINLDRLVAQIPGNDPEAVSAAGQADLLMHALRTAPEQAVQPLEVVMQSFAERIRRPITAGAAPIVTAAQPENDLVEQQMAALEDKVAALSSALEERVKEAARLEAALAAERARAPSVAASETPEPAAASQEELSTPPVETDRRQLYILAAVLAALLALIAFGAVLARRRGRRAGVSGVPAPILLNPPEEAGLAGPIVVDMPERAVAEATAPAASTVEGPEAPMASSSPPVAPVALPSRLSLAPGVQVRVTGVVPPTAAIRAAMQAAAARRTAAAAADPAAESAALGEAAAAAHPVVRALRQGNLPLFELLFSEMTDLHSPQLQRIVYGGRGEDLAIVCRAVGVDKLLFGSIFLLTDYLRGGSREEEEERAAAMLKMYDRLPPQTAQKVLAKWQRNWGGLRKGNLKSDVLH